MFNPASSTRRQFIAALIAATVLAMPAVASEPHSTDWASPESIVQALHEVVSADAGQSWDWDRFRALFIDGAMISMAVKSAHVPGLMVATPEELIQMTETSYASTGFHEIPLIIRTTEYGAMALVTNSFEIKLRRDDAEPLMRGLNHFQLLHDGERWWIVSNVSTIETDDWKLPATFDPSLADSGQ